ncbi:hypothetical protein NP233_g529 [Leucocoprinus birnbaumii]|uniref:FAD/NAD(P)-binding domain-containing protein n=1 Tax=Leucocoprinus birnbaumii TaxID=56174 RepID=A0AAD5Z070_9AGAR|nr:hypothetical protein NP233_g529 [Leucocoprinus birnbaumii]
MPRNVKVAIVGSGLSGLTAAWLLARPLKNQDVNFEVHLFEKADSLGMDAASTSLNSSELDKQWRIDVPMRAFQGGYYPQLISMYKTIGVRIRQADFSFSFSQLITPTSSLQRKITTNFIYNGSSGRAGFGKPASFSAQTNKSALSYVPRQLLHWVAFLWTTTKIIICFLMSTYYAAPFLRSSELEDKSFGEWAEDMTPRNFLSRSLGLDVGWQTYVRDVMIPMWSATCTATKDDILNYPAIEFLDLIWLTFGTRHYVLANGVRDVVAELSKDTKNIHLSAPITSISLDPKTPHLASVTCTNQSGKQETFHGFDHVIFATEAKTAASILHDWISKISACAKSPPSIFKQNLVRQAEVLGKFRYRSSVVVNHTDNTLLPDDIQDRRELNMIYYHGHELSFSEKHSQGDPSVCVSSSHTMTTHILPKPEGYPAHLPTVYQTTNPIIPPRRDAILSIARLERAVPTVEARKALRALCEIKDRRWWECPAVARTKLGPLQGAGRVFGRRSPGIWICGSYAFPGIPLLEGCVVSAKNVVVQGILQCEGTELLEEPWVVS